MPEYIKALIVLLTIGTGIFYFSKPLFIGFGMEEATLKRRWATWCLLTAAGFLSVDYWIFLGIVSIVLISARKNESNPISLFFFLIFVLPIIRLEIPGFGGIRYLLEVDNIRIATLILLLPIYFQERKRRQSILNTFVSADVLVVGYFLWSAMLKFREDDVIGVARYSIYCFVDIGLPYYVVSRCVRDVKTIKQIFANFALSGVIVAAIAVFEFGKRWLLYVSIPEALGIPGNLFYLERGDYLRAAVTSGQPIVLGYYLIAIFGAFLYFYKDVLQKNKYALLLLLIVAGEIASLSKGPWVGMVLLIAVMIFTAKDRIKYVIYSSIFLTLAAVAMTATDEGRKMIEYLPFVGNLDEGSTTYRQLLFKKSIEAISENPFAGSVDYLYSMEELRQGEGIIDLVNTYLIVALDNGLIGLSLFLGCIALVMYKIYAATAFYKKIKEERSQAIGRVLFAIMLGQLFVLAVCSPISTIPIVLTLFSSLAVAYAQTTVKPMR